jgi:hypothetical protein
MIDKCAKFCIVSDSIYKLAGDSVGLTFKPMIPSEVRGSQKICYQCQIYEPPYFY